MKRSRQPQVTKYRQLLTILIATFSLSPFFEANVGSILFASLLLYTIILIINSFPIPKPLFWLYIVVAAKPLVCRQSQRWAGYPYRMTKRLRFWLRVSLYSIWVLRPSGLGEIFLQSPQIP